jgi:hypothetical protein
VATTPAMTNAAKIETMIRRRIGFIVPTRTTRNLHAGGAGTGPVG